MPRTHDQFLAAYDEHADALFRFCYAFAGRRDDATDAVQEAFVRTWTYLASGRRIEKMKPFLYRTARNVLIDRSRKATEHSLDGMREAGWDVPDERAADPAATAEAARAVRLVAQLEQPYREAFLMRYVHDLSPRDIASITGESENAISVRIHRGLEKIRTLMGINQ